MNHLLFACLMYIVIHYVMNDISMYLKRKFTTRNVHIEIIRKKATKEKQTSPKRGESYYIAPQT